MGFWLDWIKQLQNGFGNFSGNYPPLYVLWLWVVGGVFRIFDFPLQTNFALKFFCLIPVYFAHLFLLRFAFGILEKRNWELRIKKIILLFIAVNPALIIVGSVWGQVDILAPFFVVFAFAFAFDKKRQNLFVPFYVLSLLCKFQMVAFLPVFGAIFILRAKKMWKGILFSVPPALLVFSPFYFAGNLQTAFKNSYTNAVGFYNDATCNAANIWLLLLGKSAPDTASPFVEGVLEFPLSLLSAHYLGIFSFIAVSIAGFIFSLSAKSPKRFAELSTFVCVAFFFLLPQMHERYLSPAVMASFLMILYNYRNWKIPTLINLAFFLNVSVILGGIRGNDMLTATAYLSAFLFLIFMLKIFFSRFLSRIPPLNLPLCLPEIFLIFVLCVMTFALTIYYKPKSLALAENELWLISMPIVKSEQSYKTMQKNLSVDKNILTVDRTRFANGIGTHAISEISFELPPNADKFLFSAGLDDESSGGSVKFIVELDRVKIWNSKEMRSRKIAEGELNILGGKILTLKTDPLGDQSYDHADWLNPRIRILKNE